jgi:hypothetical protein
MDKITITITIGEWTFDVFILSSGNLCLTVLPKGKATFSNLTGGERVRNIVVNEKLEVASS